MVHPFIQEGNIDCLVDISGRRKLIHSKVVTATAGIQLTLTCVISDILCLNISVYISRVYVPLNVFCKYITFYLHFLCPVYSFLCFFVSLFVSFTFLFTISTVLVSKTR